MDIAMITPILVMVNGGRNYSYGLFIAIALATYTTYRIITAIRNFVKTRKSDNILTAELRLINLTDALLAILTLQNALITVKDGFSTEMTTMSMWTSGGIIAIILFMTIFSLLKVKIKK